MFVHVRAHFFKVTCKCPSLSHCIRCADLGCVPPVWKNESLRLQAGENSVGPEPGRCLEDGRGATVPAASFT